MPASPNVTTPGGFFIGIGGIVSFCIVGAIVFWWVKAPATSDEFRAQQIALGLRPGPDVVGAAAEKKNGETAALVKAAGYRYNAGVEPDLDNLDDLRGVVRYRESEKSKDDAAKALTAAPAWKDKAKGEVTMPIDLAMKVVASRMKDRKQAPSAIKVDVVPALDPSAPPMMPNLGGGGARTVIFADPNAPVPVPAPAPAPAATPGPVPGSTAPVKAPAAGGDAGAPRPAPAPPTPPSAPPPTTPPAVPPKPASASSSAIINVTAAASPAAVPPPNRPPLLNWPEPKK